ncbi:hypothetical protein [Peloplasma aerotolerans]|uniref:Uncharacterized protein n=1 Tax=Peloplasma aerotolerans TaxID=3044389 RepID=A0AAW6U5G3_9MOLU|nr:hypothetical protein [Mariniplasma sp. M4Ah]MDI6452155.1 hypothetical protein [Mariniplasma sp. M4Ah]
MMKRIMNIFLEPLKAFANRNFAEKVSIYFSKNKWFTYVVSVIITLIILFFAYVLPNIAW